MKLHDQKQVGFIWLTRPPFIIEESQDGDSNRSETWRKESMKGPWRSAGYWFATHGSLSLLFIIDSRTLEPPTWAGPSPINH